MNRWLLFALVAMLVVGVAIALKSDAPSGQPPPCPPDCTEAGVVCPPFCTREFNKKPPPKHAAPVPIGTKILNEAKVIAQKVADVAESGRQSVDKLLTGNSTKTNQKNGFKTGAQVGCSGKVGAKADAFSKQCASGVSCGGYCVSVAEAKKSLLKKTAEAAESGRQSVDKLLTGNSTKTNQKNGFKTGAQVGCSGGAGAAADAFSKQCKSGQSCGGYCVECVGNADCPSGKTCTANRTCTDILEYCRKNGGGANKKCYTDRGMKVCSSTKERNCYPNDLPCSDFGIFDSKNGKCGTDKQGGGLCLTGCCVKQHEYCHASNSTKEGYFTCMKQRGCGDKKFRTCSLDGGKTTVDSKGRQIVLFKPSSKTLNYDVSGKKNACGSESQGGADCQETCCVKQHEYCHKSNATKEGYFTCMKQRGCGDPKFLSCNVDGSKKTVDSKGRLVLSAVLYKPSSKKLNYDVTPKKNVCGSASQGGQACQLECAKVQATFCGCGANSAGCLADRGAGVEKVAFQQSGTWWPNKCAKTGESCKAGPDCADHDLVTGKGTQCCKGKCKQKKADWIGAYYCPDESKCWSQCCDDSTCKSLFPPAKSGGPFPKPVCVANKCKALAKVGDITGAQVGCSGGRGYKNQDGFSKQCKSGISCGGKCVACRNWGDCDRTPGKKEFCDADFTCKKLLANGKKTGLQVGCSGGKSGQGQLTLSDGYSVKCQSGISCGGFCKQCVGAKDCEGVKDAKGNATPLCIDRTCTKLLGVGGVTGAQVGVSGGRGYKQDVYSKKCTSGISAGGKCVACRNWGDCGKGEFCQSFKCTSLLGVGGVTGAQVGCSGGRGYKQDGYSKKCASGISCGGKCKACRNWGDCGKGEFCNSSFECKSLISNGHKNYTFQIGCSTSGPGRKCKSGCSCGGSCKAKTRDTWTTTTYKYPFQGNPFASNYCALAWGCHPITHRHYGAYKCK